MKHSFWILLTLIATSCDLGKEQAPDVSHIEMQVTIERLDEQFFTINQKEEIAQFLEKYPEVTKNYFLSERYPNNSVLVDQLFQFRHQAANDTLYKDTKGIFEGKMTALEKEIESTFRYIKYYFPEFKVPKVYAMISGFGGFGFGQDIFIADNFVVIGLDYYAGDDAIYRPSDIPLYIQKRYQPENIIPHLVLFLSAGYNAFRPQDNTLLADMIFYGKAHYFMEKALPNTSDSLIMDYSNAQLLDCKHNSSTIWGHFVENDLFYEKNNFTKNKYVGEAPKVSAISDQCPGRVGRWLGWQIVRAYAEEFPDISLQELMQTAEAQQIFQKSKYRP